MTPRTTPLSRRQRQGEGQGEGAGQRAVDLVQLPPRRDKKKVVRAAPDRTQRWRLAFQLAFLLLNLAIGVQFWFFVRYFETGGETPYLPRPPGVEGWLPIAALMNLKAAVLTGRAAATVHPAGMFLLVAFLAITLLFRKAFCSWLCPSGRSRSGSGSSAARIFRRTFALPRWADIRCAASSTCCSALFLYAVVAMSVEAIRAFLASPYGLVADVKMLNFFRHMGTTAADRRRRAGVLSVLVQNFWCRYLCPYGALMGLSRGSARAHPARRRAVHRLREVREGVPVAAPGRREGVDPSAECTGCLECVAVCPVKDALEISPRRRLRLPAWAVAAGIAVVFLGLTAFARLTGHWHTEIDPRVYSEIIPRVSELDHPR